jgi:S1-C subfamily serine protease
MKYLLVLCFALVGCKSGFKPEESVVKVLNAEGTGGGTGWVANTPSGKVIVSNAHVCAVGSAGYVRIDGPTGISFVKKILKQSTQRDLCLIEGIDAPALSLAKKVPARFDKLSTVGHPLLNPVTPAEGLFIGTAITPFYEEPTGEKGNECSEGAALIQVETFFGIASVCKRSEELGLTTLAIYPGNSGSPVLNEDGRVIGVINSAKQDNRGMFIPLDYVREILAQ